MSDRDWQNKDSLHNASIKSRSITPTMIPRHGVIQSQAYELDREESEITTNTSIDAMPQQQHDGPGMACTEVSS